MSQGHATRSTLAFSRVIHFMIFSLVSNSEPTVFPLLPAPHAEPPPRHAGDSPQGWHCFGLRGRHTTEERLHVVFRPISWIPFLGAMDAPTCFTTPAPQ